MPTLASKLFEERLQLSAVAVEATLESLEFTEHSYPEDSDSQYPEETIRESVEASQIDQPDSVINRQAFPTTPASPSLEPVDAAAAQALLFSTPADTTIFSLQPNDEQVSPNLFDAEFASNTIPLLLGEQQLDSDLDSTNVSSKNDGSAAAPQENALE